MYLPKGQGEVWPTLAGSKLAKLLKVGIGFESSSKQISRKSHLGPLLSVLFKNAYGEWGTLYNSVETVTASTLMWAPVCSTELFG